jgi:hypothetical protein
MTHLRPNSITVGPAKCHVIEMFQFKYSLSKGARHLRSAAHFDVQTVSSAQRGKNRR